MWSFEREMVNTFKLHGGINEFKKSIIFTKRCTHRPNYFLFDKYKFFVFLFIPKLYKCGYFIYLIV